MQDLSRYNPTSRFSGLADLYAKHRPGYPEEAIRLILEYCGLGGDTLLVDVGCGTGISSRLFAARGVPVLGIEPNDDMRHKAAAEPAPPGGPPPHYLPGRAEATGLPDGCAAAVLSAQAFHWFDAPNALAEFHRILRPGGGVAIMGNERDESDPATAAYGRVLLTGPDAHAVEAPRARAGEPLLVSSLFTDARRVQLAHRQEMDEEGLLGRAFSASYAPREPAAAAAFADALRAVFAAHQQQGRFVLHYQTTIYLARRRP